MNAGKKKSIADELFGDFLDEGNTQTSNSDKTLKKSISELKESSQILTFPQEEESATGVSNKEANEKTEAIAQIEQEELPTAASVVSTEEPTKKRGQEGTLLGTSPQVTLSSDKVKPSVGKFVSRAASMGLSGMGASLAQSENLKIAQRRITDLEMEVEKLRAENIDLSVAGETMLKRAEEAEAKYKEFENKMEMAKFNHQEEAKLLKESLSNLELEMGLLKEKNDTMEAKLSTNMQKIKVRERELENRLELVKMENSAIIRNKNEMILDLKRNIDQLKLELEKYRNKGSELNRRIDQKDETLKRTVKTLRMALTMLEGGGFVKKNEKKD